MTLLISLAGLIIFTVLVNEVLKKANRLGGAGGRTFYCKMCGRSMILTVFHWSYRLPFEMWAPVAKHNLSPNMVQRYICPDRHTQAWFLPSGGDRECDVLVTKVFPRG